MGVLLLMMGVWVLFLGTGVMDAGELAAGGLWGILGLGIMAAGAAVELRWKG